MNLQQLLQQMEVVRQRALTFQEHHAAILDSDDDLLLNIVDELNVTLEELHVAEEELLQQNEELTQAQHQAAVEQRRYQALFEFAPDAYLVTDSYGAILEANQAAYRLLEVPTGQLPGWPLTAFFPVDGRRNMRNILLKMSTPGQAKTWELKLSTSTGRRFTAELTAAAVQDDAGHITAIRWLLRDVTTRKAAEERLQRSEARLAEAQQLAQLGHWDWDALENAVSWSDEMYRIYGLEPQSQPITYEGFLERVHPADRSRISTIIEQARQTALPFVFEHRIVRADGAIRTLQAHGEAALDEHGQVIRLLGTGQDITERKEIEEQVRQLNVNLEQRVAERTRELSQANTELQRSQARFEGIITLSEDAIISIDHEQCITLVNPSVERLFGYRPEELIGQPLDRLLPERFAGIHHQYVEAFSRSPGVTRPMNERGPIYGRRKDGSEFPAEASISKFEVQGEPVVTVRLRDITDRLRADAALRESEERFRVMADLAPTMVWTADPAGTLTYVNQQWLDYCGETADPRTGRWPTLKLHPDDHDFYERQWNRAIARGEECEIEVRYRRYDGAYRWFLTRAMPRRDAEGRIMAWFGTTTDIHDHRMAEEAIGQLNQELDRRVEELETLLNVLPIGIAVAHDPDCLDITVNPTAAKLLDITNEANASKSHPDGDHLPFKVMRNGQEVSAHELPMQSAAAHGIELRDIEVDLVRADGAQFSLLEYASPLYNEHHQVRGCLGVMVDITPRKLAERRLALQYAVAHALAESTGMSEAALKVLKAVCEITDSEFGALWQVDSAAGLLRNQSVWQSTELDVTDFVEATRFSPFRLDEGLPGRAFISGQPVWVSDMTLAGLPRSEIAGKHGLHSAFAMPIRTEGAITGVLECFSRSIREPAAELIELLDAIGHQLGLFMERKQAEDDLAVRAHQQAIVAEVGQRALSGIPLQELLDEAAAHIALTLGVGLSVIAELNSELNCFMVRASVGLNDQQRSIVVPGGPESVAGYTLAGHDPLIISDLDSEPQFATAGLLGELHIVSGLSVSIQGYHGPFGAMGVYSTRRRTFSGDDVHFMQAIAHVIGLAVERARAEEALQLSRTEISAILNGVADGISAINKKGQRIYANAALTRLLHFESTREFMQLPPGQYPDQFDIYDETGQTLTEDRFPGLLALQGQATDGMLARYKFHATGDEMWVLLKSQPVFNEAGEVVMAVNIVQDITELKRAELAQRLLAEAGALLTKTVDYPTRLEGLAQLVVPRMADWCAIDILSEEGLLERLTVAHVNPEKVKWAWEVYKRFPPDPTASGGVYNVVRTGQSQFIPYITAEMLAVVTDPELREVIDQLDPHSTMVVPLIARGRNLGVMTFAWTESAHHYTRADLELAEELARRAALALDNARLYDEAQRLNVDLEQRVLQRTTELQTANVRLNAEIKERRQAEEEVRRLNADLEGRVLERTQQLERTNYDLQREIVDRKQAEKTLRLTLQKTHELYTLSQHISLLRSPEEVLQVLLSSSYLKYTTRSSVAIFDSIWHDGQNPPAGCTILTAWNREPDTPLYVGQHMSLEDYGLVPPVSRSEVLFISNLREDPRVSESMRQRLLSLRTASSILFPLVAGGEWYGMLSLHFRFVEMMNSEDILHLRGLVDEAAMAIYNFQLLENEAHARREAERANNLKLKFLAMISHELRTPLASIKGFASTLLANDVVWQPASQREFIATIDSEADKLADLIEQLLDLSRLEAGTMRITPRLENWDQILYSAQAQLQALTPQHRLLVNLAPDLPPVWVDSMRITQVITNLVNNAVKYSPPQTRIVLTIKPYHTHEVIVSVSDEGVGIPPESRGRIFEAFQQLHRERSDSSGAGLGLAICRGLIEAHGGRIWVDEHDGPGTTMSFTLPLA